MDQVKIRPERSPLTTRLAAALLMAVFILAPAATAMCQSPAAKKKTDARQFIAYYFYTTKRCSTCTRIEQWAEEAVTKNFKDELGSGKLQWQGINVQQEGNEHFIQDFELFSKTVIIAEYRNGKSVRWNNLKDVWLLNRDKPKFLNYVAGGIRTFMEEK